MSFLHFFTLEVNYNSKRNGRPGMQFFHLMFTATYNEGIHQPVGNLAPFSKI